MAWRTLVLLFAISTVTARPIEDTELIIPDTAECPTECTCSTGALSDLVVQCLGYKQKSSVLPRLTNQMEGFITRLDIENSQISVLVENFLNIDREYSKSLHSLRLSNSSVSKISTKAFENAKLLEELELSNNKLVRLPNEVFNSQYMPNLRLVSLSYNEQLNFPKHGAFLKSNSIEELDLSYCGVTDIHAHSLTQLPKLVYLNLANNNIKKLHADAFSRLNYLEYLDLSGNEIINLPMKLPPTLQVLNLRDNPRFNISSLEDLSPDVSISELDLSQCNIESLPRNVINQLNDLTSLNLSHNALTNIYFPLVMRQLQYLDISFNNLQGTLDANIVGSCSRLETLRFRGNKGLRLPEYGLQGDLTKLYLLDMSGCDLDIIPATSIEKLTALAHLNLSNNALETLPKELFKPFSYLSSVDLSSNRLQYIPDSIFYGNKLKHLSLASNPGLAPVLNYKILDNQNFLSYLNIASCDFTDVPDHLPEGLETLVANNNNFRDPTRLNELIEKSLFLLRNIAITDNPWKCNFEFKQFVGNLRERQIFDETYNESWSGYQTHVCLNEKLSSQNIHSRILKPYIGDFVTAHSWSILTFVLTMIVFIMIAISVSVLCKRRVSSNLSRNYKHLSESSNVGCTTPHVTNKIYRPPSLTSIAVKPTTFSTNYLFPRFPVTESEIPASYVSGNYHHGQLEP